jgi:hypothetical protein
VTDPTDDAERIAALLDGRLGARERAEVLARLGESDAAFEAFVDAAAVLRESPEESVRPLTRPQRWRRPALALAAALILGAIIVPFVRSRSVSSEGGDPQQFVALLSPGGLPSDLDATPWSTTRGDAEPLTDAARATRIGARLTDLTVAVQSGDTAAPQIARTVAALLGPIPASAPASSIFRSIANPNATKQDRERLLSQGTAAATSLVGSQPVSKGAWLEAARIAASRHDAAFFNSARSRAMMATEPALQTIRVGSGTDWVRFESDPSRLLATVSS